MDAKSFYGSSYAKAADTSKLDQAYDRLVKAMNTTNPNLTDKMLVLAAKAETEAFTPAQT